MPDLKVHLDRLMNWYFQELGKLEHLLWEARHITYDQFQIAVEALEEELRNQFQEQAPKEAQLIPFPGADLTLPQRFLVGRDPYFPHARGSFEEHKSKITVSTRVGAAIDFDERRKIILLRTPRQIEAGTGFSFLTEVPFKKGERVRIIIEKIDPDIPF